MAATLIQSFQKSQSIRTEILSGLGESLAREDYSFRNFRSYHDHY
jgi:hypothetical protein